jgi:Flp pilus assembly protein TadG
MRDQPANPNRVKRFSEVELPMSAAGARRHPCCGLAAKLREEETGSDLVETALVLPLYLMLIFGITSFAILFFAYCNATYASRTAVRYAVVHSSTSLAPCNAATLQSIVNPLLWGAPSGGVVVTSQWNPSNTIGNVVSVTVQMTYTHGLPYISPNGLVVQVTSQGVILH